MSSNPDDIFTIDTKLKFMFWTMGSLLMYVFYDSSKEGIRDRTMYYKTSATAITGYMKDMGRTSVVQLSENLFLFSGSNWLGNGKFIAGKKSVQTTQMSIVVNYNDYFKDIKEFPFDRNWIASVNDFIGSELDQNDVALMKRENPLLIEEDIEYGKLIHEKTDQFHQHQMSVIMRDESSKRSSSSSGVTFRWRFDFHYFFASKLREQYTKTLRSSYLERAKQIEESNEESDDIDDADELLLTPPAAGYFQSKTSYDDSYSSTGKEEHPRSKIKYPEISTGGQSSVWFGLGRNTSPFVYTTSEYI
ncbi:hypothetical protein BN7_6664 [Wickerhamomyces ciferrii]|uniref:Uncharacterized protein n=1 Tax=Wickerhamomyces ciferrii (strain ATCC 14091 / BCRC 22168 / CBS 111 / JCM 3599 / NBRC 0793 / NRRL Y-1031 F-60-10) TaxID=1206466 RepID=K0KP47_WICCF|nr:uncharacterized protein BN7_6664 [Wickerhamomyces ciferrii]CCH47055.1 hypothetical protein BN7_6664 [Wickerhamomyces ciferrii]